MIGVGPFRSSFLGVTGGGSLTPSLTQIGHIFVHFWQYIFLWLGPGHRRAVHRVARFVFLVTRFWVGSKAQGASGQLELEAKMGARLSNPKTAKWLSAKSSSPGWFGRRML